MTMSWHMMMEFTPPMIACIVSTGVFSFTGLKATKECVMAIPSVELAEKVVEVGNCSGRDTDKFATCGLTSLPAECVSASLVAECFANLECRVVDTRLANKCSLLVLQVVNAWTDPKQPNPPTIHHRGYGDFTVVGKIIHLESLMA